MGSHYGEACRNDPDVIVAVTAEDADGERPPWRPRGEDMSLMLEVLVRILDRLGELTARKWADPMHPKAKKPKLPPPFPQPFRALDAAMAKAAQDYLSDLEDEVAEAQARWRAQQGSSEGSDTNPGDGPGEPPLH